MRKDFILDEYQVVEARAAGADAVLLIVALHEPASLTHLTRCAEQLGLAAVVEVHSKPELAAARDAGAEIIGVNSRDLRTLAVDVQVCQELIEDAPPGALMVAESGIRSRDEIDQLAARGYRAFLIGERFMTSADPGAVLRECVGTGAAGGAAAGARRA